MPEGNTYDFLKSIAAARVVPAPPEGSPGTPSEFTRILPTEEIEEANPFFKQDQDPSLIAAPTGTQHFSRVFVLWRDWTSCKRCKDALTSETVILPEDTDYVCPHVQENEYKQAMDRCLQGKGAVSLREYYNLHNGTRCVHMEWAEASPEYLEKLKEETKRAKENSLAPTFGTGDTGSAVG